MSFTASEKAELLRLLRRIAEALELKTVRKPGQPAICTETRPMLASVRLVDLEFWTGRARAAFSKLGVLTVGDLAAKSEQEILGVGGVGPGTVGEIKRKLSLHGLWLKGDLYRKV